MDLVVALGALTLLVYVVATASWVAEQRAGPLANNGRQISVSVRLAGIRGLPRNCWRSFPRRFANSAPRVASVVASSTRFWTAECWRR